jgi:predicted O-linked N-acetylglucosamine transferase (SPINDLY family)
MSSTTDIQKLQQAMRMHQAGDLGRAADIYQHILRSRPDHPDALHMLGLARCQQGNVASGIELISKAITVNPSVPAYHINLGKVLTASGRLVEAESAFENAIEIQPDIVDAYLGLANVHQAKGEIDRSMARLTEALKIAPQRADIHYAIGVYSQQAGRYDVAIDHYRDALSIRPGLAQVHNNLGAALQLSGKYDEAALEFGRAVSIQPDYCDALCNLGSICSIQGHGRDAIEHFTAALKANPNMAAAHCGLANALRDLDEIDSAIAHYKSAISIDPENASATFNLAGTLQSLGKIDQAINTYKRAVAIDPNDVFALNALVHQLHHACAWDELEEYQRRLLKEFRAGHAGFMPFSFLSIPATAEDQLACAKAFTDKITRHITPYPSLEPSESHKDRNTAKIRIGYLSSDYHEHATAYLISELLELHDKSRFEIFAYSFGIDDHSGTRQRIIRACDKFIDIKNLSHADSAARIRSDRVDILVDLKGYTEGMRAGIPAYRPAPIQVNWLGYPGTMGAEFIDYIISDHFITPPGSETCYTEKIIKLPDCYQVNDRCRPISNIEPTRLSCALPDSVFVFCSFNQTYKFNPETFNIWVNLLKAIPDSVLWLLESNPFAPDNLRHQAQLRGVAPDRLIFAPKLPLADHLARYRLADLFLDTSPYNSHTTASDALWAGLPLVTMAGDTFASRVAGSLLLNVGMKELITDSLETYQACALKLAGDKNWRDGLRQRLIDHQIDAPLWNSRAFTHNLETAYKIIYERWLAGEPTAHLDVPRIVPDR